MAEPRPKITSFRDLEIWKRGVILVQEIYEISRSFPKEELYGLTSQIRRSGVSIPSNIAEGFGRYRNSEYKQFLFIAFGSAAELTTQLIIAQKLGYTADNVCDTMTDEITQISKMTMSLIKKL